MGLLEINCARLISRLIFDGVTYPVDRGNAMDTKYLGFYKALDSHQW